jgi:lipid-binding SYLF domain-containing protein
VVRQSIQIFCLMLALLVPGGGGLLAANSDQDAKLDEVIEVLEALQAIPEKSIPPALWNNAAAVAVIPGVIKVGMVVGGRYGKGILSVRDADRGWSGPIFISITGGSVGWQIGAQSTDVILVFKSKKSIDGILEGKFTLGADAAMAAGPLGRKASAATDSQLKAEIYSYSRSRGLFVGIALDGAAVKIEHRDNARYYGVSEISAAKVVEGAVNVPGSADELKRVLIQQAKN